MNYPLVSVIIPTYNRSHTIKRAIDSVLNQNYQNKEIIVVDDGSTDNTEAALRSYRGKIRALKQTNKGPSSARNYGIREAKGEYIAFLDSDDEWVENKLAKQMKVLSKCSKDVILCICDTKLNAEKYSGKSSFQIAKIYPKKIESIWLNATEVLISRFVLFNQAVVVRRDILISIGAFNEDLKLMEDYDLSLRLSTNGLWAIINETLVLWHLDVNTSISNAVTKTNADELAEKIINNFIVSSKIDNNLTKIAIRRIREIKKIKKINHYKQKAEEISPMLDKYIKFFFTTIERFYRKCQSWPKVHTTLLR